MSDLVRNDSLCIGVVNWNSAADTVRALSLLQREWTVVVIDNSSSATGELEDLRSGLPEATILPQPTNLGYGAGMNVGIRWAAANGFHKFLMLNPDTYPEIALIKAMVGAAQNRAAVGVRQAAGSPDGGQGDEYVTAANLRRAKPFPIPFTLFDSDVVDVDIVTGAAIMVDVNAVVAVGLLDEGYFHYKEEFDLMFKLRNRFGAAGLVTNHVLLHRRGGSLGIESATALYYHFRNEILFLRDNFGVTEYLRMPGLFRSAAAVFAGADRARRRAIAGGLRDGFRGRRGPKVEDS